MEKTEIESVGIESFTLTELFAQGAGGCGMSLLQPGSDPGEGFLLIHGIGDEPALMKIEGEWVSLQRTASEGEEFYGQQTSQTFVNENLALIVETEVILGGQESEAIVFSEALLRVQRGDRQFEIAVEGDAGC